MEDVTVDGSSRIVDEGKDFITVEKDFKADEISTTEENIASPSMWPGFSISNIKNDGQVTDRNNIISSDDLVVGTAVSQRVSCSSTTSVSYTHSHTAHNGGITEYEVAISMDGVNWTTVKHGTVDADLYRQGNNVAVHARFHAIKAQYVRLTALKAVGRIAEEDNQYARVAELKLFGEKEVVEEPVTKDELKNLIDSVKDLDESI